MTDEEIKALIASGRSCHPHVVSATPSCLPPMWEMNLKDIADHSSERRQAQATQLNTVTALLNALGIKALTEGPQSQQALASMLLQRQFASDNEKSLRSQINDNETALMRGVTFSQLVRSLDSNELLKSTAIAALIEGLGWIRAVEVDITGAKSIAAAQANHVNNIAQKAIDTAYGGVIGLGTLPRGSGGIPQPLRVAMEKQA